MICARVCQFLEHTLTHEHMHKHMNENAHARAHPRAYATARVRNKNRQIELATTFDCDSMTFEGGPQNHDTASELATGEL